MQQDLNQKWRRPAYAIAALAAGAAIALTGCSSTDTAEKTSATPEASASVAATAELNNASAQETFRAAVSAPEDQLGQYVALPPDQIPAMAAANKAAADAGYTPEVYTVKEVKADGDKADVTVEVAVPSMGGRAFPMNFGFVKVDGTWKLSAEGAAKLMSTAGEHGGH